MVSNRLVNKLKSRIPIYGNNQALQNHINNAIKNSGNLETMMKNIENLPSENLPSSARSALEKFKQDFANFKAEIQAEVKEQTKQDLKAELKAMSDNGEIDLIELAKARQQANLTKNTAENSPNLAKNSFDDEVDILSMAKDRNTNITQNLGYNSPNLAKNSEILPNINEKSVYNESIRGENFTMDNPNLTKPKSDLNVKMDLAPQVRDMAKITTDEISADLEYLAEKHPEMFSKPSEVFKLIKEIKENPTFFYNNNRLDYALIVKRLQEPNKIGKLAVEKSSGEAKHATAVNEKDLSRLERVSKANQKEASALSELSSDKVAKLENQGSGYQTNDIIPQNAKQASKTAEKSEIEQRKHFSKIAGAVTKSERAKVIANLDDTGKAEVNELIDDMIKSDKFNNEVLQKWKNELNAETKAEKEAISEAIKEPKPLPKNKDGKIYPNSHIMNQMRQSANISDKQYLQETAQKVGGAINPKWTENIATNRRDIELFYDIQPNPNHGTNYAEFYHDGIGAFNKIKAEKSGQVAGAFERKELGDIDLVWGAIKDENGKVQGYGLSKIVTKHKEITPELLDEIVKTGEIEVKDGRYSIVLNKDNKSYRVGLKSNWHGEPTKNKWIVTAYEVTNKDKGGAKSIHANSITSDSRLTATLNKDIIPQLKQKYTKNSAVSVAKEQDFISIEAKTPTGDIQRFVIFDDGKILNQVLDQYKTQILRSGDFNPKSLNEVDEIINKVTNSPKNVKSQAELNGEFDKLNETYDIEAFLKDRENINAKDTYNKKTTNGFGGARSSYIDGNGERVWHRNAIEHNYKSDFSITKGDVKALRKQIQNGEFDENLLNKLKADLESADKQGYDYTHAGVTKQNEANELSSEQIREFSQNMNAKERDEFIENIEKNAKEKFEKTGKEPKAKELPDGRMWSSENANYVYMFSNPHIGVGSVSGTLNGLQKDENGNISFDPAKFAYGFIGGAVASKALKETAVKGAKKYAESLAKTYPNIAKGNPKLMAQIANKTLKDKFGNLAVESGERLQSGLRKLIGESADWNKKVIGGENAYGKLSGTIGKTHKANLATAKELEAKGASELEIWEKTGWFFDDLDKKWKFEINPNGGKIKEFKGTGLPRINDILDDPQLFKAYPQLKEVAIFYDTGKRTLGSYIPDQKLISVNRELLKNPTELKATLYHEIQHAIQEIEKFSGGTNTAIIARNDSYIRHMTASYNRTAQILDDLKAKGDTTSEYYKDMQEQLKYIDSEIEKSRSSSEIYDAYLRQGGEAEARNVSNRLLDKADKHPLTTLDIPRNERINLNTDGIAESRNLQNKEKRGIYNVAFNDKRSSQIYKDLDDIEQAIKFEKGRADTEKGGNIKSGFGALHIKKHLDKNKFGYVTKQEYLNMGEVVRNGTMSQVGQKRVYKLEKDGVTLRVVIGDSKNGKERVISFYSDRKAK